MVQIIPKDREKHSLLSNIVLLVAIGAFVVTVGGYWALLFFENRSSRQLEETEAALGAEKTPEQQQLESDVFLAQARLKDFGRIISSRKDFLPMFEFLEDTVHPEVVFQSANVGKELSTVQIKGVAAGFRELEEQLTIFKAREELRKVDLASLSLDQEGGVSFQITLTFPQDFFSSL